MKRLVLLALAVLVLTAAPPAAAKGDVHAHLESHAARDVRAGTTIRVVWRLYSIEAGERRPFDAGGLFVRLRSATGARGTRAYGEGEGGRYVARIKVPRGGIAAIRFGLEGIRSIHGHQEPANHYFPLDNDPFAQR